MQRILFIHGYGVGIENIRLRKIPEFHAGFSDFAEEINKGSFYEEVILKLQNDANFRKRILKH